MAEPTKTTKSKAAPTATPPVPTTRRAKVVHRVRRPVAGFSDFLREQSVVGLAIGLVLGTQVKQLSDQIIASFINPLIGLLLPGTGTLSEKTFVVHLNGKQGVFGWGVFVVSLISFVFVAAIVYSTFKILKLDKLTKKKDV